MSGVHLHGLEGTNPLGFLAALGVQVVFAEDREQPRLWWSEDITPHAIIDADFTVERVASCALDAFGRWHRSAALNPTRQDGSPMHNGDTLKLHGDDVRTYLGHASTRDSSSPLATALLAEGSVDKQGAAKPSDFYFAAGNQHFLSAARTILAGASIEDLEAGLNGPWPYQSQLPSLGWDVSDDRVYALRAHDPAPEKKRTNPGPEALALLGLSLYPVFAGQGRTATQGCSGTWKAGAFSWPLWHNPASPLAVKSLIAHAYGVATTAERRRWSRSWRGWGISNVYRSPIRRSDQGGYGTFGPPEVLWRQDTGG